MSGAARVTLVKLDGNGDSQAAAARCAERGNVRREAVGSLARGLAVLHFLQRATRPMSLVEIAEGVGLDSSATLRLLRSLEDLEQVIRLGDGRRYFCSPRALRPLPLLHPLEQLRREAAAPLYAFSAEVGMSAVLVAYLGRERLVVHVATSAGTLNPYYNAWLEGPLYGSGPGKALLMSMTPAERRSLLGDEPFKKYTERTISTWEALDRDLKAAIARGYALVQDEFCIGLSAMSCNILDRDAKAIGCIALTGHSQDLTEDRITQIGPRLISLTRLLPMQAQSLSLVATFCGH